MSLNSEKTLVVSNANKQQNLVLVNFLKDLKTKLEMKTNLEKEIETIKAALKTYDFTRVIISVDEMTEIFRISKTKYTQKRFSVDKLKQWMEQNQVANIDIILESFYDEIECERNNFGFVKSV